MAHTPESKLKKFPEIPREHIEREFFETPREPILSLLGVDPAPVDWATARVLDVGAGRGAIGRTIKEVTGALIDSVEIREEECDALNAHSENVWIADFLSWEPPTGYKPDVIISNPPFSKAVDIAERAFSLFPNTPLIMLQRLEWLSSRKRMRFFANHPVQSLWTLSQRPAFLGANRQRDIWTVSWFGWHLPASCTGIRVI